MMKWPPTIVGAVAVFGLSADGTFDLISANAGKLSQPVEASPRFNVPPVKQIGTLEPRPVVSEKRPLASLSAPPWVSKSAFLDGVGKSASQDATATLAAKQMQPGRVGPKAVNVRSAPSKSSPKLGTLQAGSPVETGEVRGGWTQVRYSQGSGWVYSTYLEGQATASVTVRGGAQKPTPTEAPRLAKTGKVVEAGSRIVVRAAPDRQAKTVFRLSRGERVRIVAREGEWVGIATATGEGGWIRVQ